MKKITKEMCYVFLKDYYKSKIVSQFIISIFAVITLWFFTKNIFAVVIAALSLVMLCIIQGIKIKNKINSINLKDFYIEEDVVIDFKKRFKMRRNGADNEYIYIFKKYGKHTISLNLFSLTPTIEIPLHKERNISSLSIDRLSSESYNKGDLFYLLICDEDGKKMIVQSFYKYHFDLQKEDFDYIDGKYYCKEF